MPVIAGGRAPARVRPQDTVIEQQIDARARHEDRQLFEQLERGKDQLPRAVAPRVRKGVGHAAVRQALEASLRERRPQKVMTEPLQPRPIVGTYRAVRVQVEAPEMRVARTARRHPRCIGIAPGVSRAENRVETNRCVDGAR